MSNKKGAPNKDAVRASAARTRRPSVVAATQSLPTVDEIEARLALEDYTAALELARARQAALPDDAKAPQYIRRCEETLTEMCLSRIGDVRQKVRLSMSGSELQWLSIDHRAGFMVSRVDGPITVEELLDVCGMPRVDGLRTLYDLLQQKVITLEDGE